MTGLEIAIGVVLIILSVVIIAVILLQEGDRQIWGQFRAPANHLDRAKPALSTPYCRNGPRL